MAPGLSLPSELGPHRYQVYSPILSAILLWPALAVQAKRWHDRGRSAWWLLVNLVPYIGPLWVIVECGLLPGTRGPNRFGEDPRERGGPGDQVEVSYSD